MTFRLHSISVRFDNTHYRGQIWGDLSAIVEGHGGMADSERCATNLFARYIFRPEGSLPAKLERNRKKIVCLYMFGPLSHALLILINLC